MAQWDVRCQDHPGQIRPAHCKQKYKRAQHREIATEWWACTCRCPMSDEALQLWYGGHQGLWRGPGRWRQQSQWMRQWQQQHNKQCQGWLAGSHTKVVLMRLICTQNNLLIHSHWWTYLDGLNHQTSLHNDRSTRDMTDALEDLRDQLKIMQNISECKHKCSD